MPDRQAPLRYSNERNGRHVDIALVAIARMRLCNQDTRDLIEGAKLDIALSYALMAEVDLLLAHR